MDEIDPEVEEASHGMIASMPTIPARTIYGSTWHRVDGPMARLIAKTPGNRVRVHRWNIWESAANCPRDRHDQGRGCDKCDLAVPCLAKAREFWKDPERKIGILAQARGLYRIEDLVKAYRHVSAATWDAEYLCLRPSVAGMVYPEFDPQVHAVEKAPEGLKIYRAIDWGFGEFVCLWIGESKDGTMYVLDAYQAQEGTLSDHAKYILAHRIQAVTATYCDPAGSSRNDQTGRSNVQQFNALGIPCRYTTTPRLREVRNGIQMVRGLLRPASGPPRLYYVRSPGAKVFEAAMFGYRNRQVNKIYIDEPQDPQEHEHIPDALRYAVVNRSVPQEVVVVGYGAA